MEATNHQCVVCERDDRQVPLIQLQYSGKIYWICPQHFPLLIHMPEQLVGKLPGAERLVGNQHDPDEEEQAGIAGL